MLRTTTNTRLLLQTSKKYFGLRRHYGGMSPINHDIIVRRPTTPITDASETISAAPIESSEQVGNRTADLCPIFGFGIGEQFESNQQVKLVSANFDGTNHLPPSAVVIPPLRGPMQEGSARRQ